MVLSLTSVVLGLDDLLEHEEYGAVYVVSCS